MGMDRDIAEVLYSEEELKRRVAALGAQIRQARFADEIKIDPAADCQFFFISAVK